MREDGVSVIICCYNSAKRITPTLTHVFEQDIPSGLGWEVILVDNNCTDNTAELAHRLHREAGNGIAFSVVQEPRPGLSFARQRGFATAKYGFVLMVDDDNWLCPDYVRTIHQDLHAYPNCAMVGGRGIPELETEPPEWFEELAYCFATGVQGESNGDQLTDTTQLYGAGCAIRLEALQKITDLGFESMLSDRKGNSLVSGGDTELSFAMRMAGYRLIYDPRIHFKHDLPETRVRWNYMKRLFDGFGRSSLILKLYEHYLKGRPTFDFADDRLWMDRSLNLIRYNHREIVYYFTHRPMNREGDVRYLHAIGLIGQLSELLSLRGNYLKKSLQISRYRDNIQSLVKSSVTFQSEKDEALHGAD